MTAVPAIPAVAKKDVQTAALPAAMPMRIPTISCGVLIGLSVGDTMAQGDF